MHTYRAKYTINGILIEEVVTASGDFLVRQILEGRYRGSRLLIIQIIKIN